MTFLANHITLLDMQEPPSGTIDFPRFVEVNGFQTMSVQVENRSGWTTEELEVKWSNDGENAYAFDTAIALTSSDNSVKDVDISAVKYIALDFGSGPLSEISVDIYIKLAGGD